MKSKVLILTSLIGLTAITTSCERNKCIDASGSIKVQEENLSTIKSVELDISANVYVQSDESITEPYYRLEASENIIDEIDMDHSGSKLTISTDRCFSNDEQIEIRIYTNDFEKADLNGSGMIILNGDDFNNSMDLDISGSGTIDAELDVNNLDATISGSGEILLFGSANDLGVRISGSGDLKGYSFSTKNADITISGSGNAELAVDSTLDVSISGSGNVYYTGSPDVDSNITGSGSVQGMN